MKSTSCLSVCHNANITARYIPANDSSDSLQEYFKYDMSSKEPGVILSGGKYPCLAFKLRTRS